MAFWILYGFLSDGGGPCAGFSAALPNADLTAPDIWNMVGSKTDCCTVCAADSECKGFVEFFWGGQNHCYMKGDVLSTTSSAGRTASIKLPSPNLSGCSTSQKPRCTSLSMAGHFSDQTFVPDAECYQAVPSQYDVRQILRGKWVVVLGGSNAIFTLLSLANQIEVDSTLDLHFGVAEPSVGYSYNFLDFVWRIDPNTGSIHRLLRNAVRDWQVPTHQRLSSGSAIAYSGNLLRLTLITSSFWPSAGAHLNGLEAGARSWSSAPQIVYHQVGLWYVWKGRGGLARDARREQAAYFSKAASYRLAGDARNMYFANVPLIHIAQSKRWI